MVGVFSLEGAGLAVFEDRWPRPLLGVRRPRSDFDSQLTIFEESGNWKAAQKKKKMWGRCRVCRGGGQWHANGQVQLG